MHKSPACVAWERTVYPGNTLATTRTTGRPGNHSRYSLHHTHIGYNWVTHPPRWCCISASASRSYHGLRREKRRQEQGTKLLPPQYSPKFTAALCMNTGTHSIRLRCACSHTHTPVMACGMTVIRSLWFLIFMPMSGSCMATITFSICNGNTYTHRFKQAWTHTTLRQRVKTHIQKSEIKTPHKSSAAPFDNLHWSRLTFCWMFPNLSAFNRWNL